MVPIVALSLKIITCIVSMLGLAGVAYQELATKNDIALYPPPGTLVNIGTHQLHLISSGTKVVATDPTVILDYGLGCCTLDLTSTQTAIAKFAQVVSYDRAGYGWSQESPASRTSEHIIEELHTLLKTAHISPPYILAGHSFGGVNMQLFAHKYPDEVVGLILIDPAHENVLDEMPSPVLDMIDYAMKGAQFAKTFLIPTGVMRLLAQQLCAQQTQNFFLKLGYPQALLLARVALSCQTKYMNTLYEETNHLKESLKQLQNTSRFFGDMPLTVIEADFTKELRSFGLNHVVADLINSIHTQHMKDLSQRSKKGTHVIAHQSGHLVPFKSSHIIVDVVKHMINQRGSRE